MRTALILVGVVILAVLAVGSGQNAYAVQYKVYERTTHQLKITQSDGSPLPDGAYPAKFSLWDASVAGNLLWSETQTMTTTNGLADVQLGAAVPIPIDILANLDTDSSFIPYLQVEFNSELLTPRTRLTAVPYARVAERLAGDLTTDEGVFIIGALTALGAPLRGTFDTVSTHIEPDSGAAAIVVDTGGVSLMMTSKTRNGDEGQVLVSTGSYDGSHFHGPAGLSVESTPNSGADVSRAEFGLKNDMPAGALHWTDGFDRASMGWLVAPDSIADSMVVHDDGLGLTTGQRTFSTPNSSVTTWEVFENLATKRAGKRLTKAQVISELASTSMTLEENEFTAAQTEASTDKRKQSLYFPETFLEAIALDVSTTSSKLFVGNLNFPTNSVDTGVVLNGSGDVEFAGTATVNGDLDMSASTGALIVPRLTTAQRNAMHAVDGMIIYNTDMNAFNFYENGAWVLKQNIVTE